MRNSAATTPNNATKAGSSIDCDIASENGWCRKAGNCVTAPSPRGEAPEGRGDGSPLIRHVITAAMLALPSTEPTCRVRLYTPDPAPASSGGRLRVAIAANGAQMNAMPTPIAANGSTSRQIGVTGVISNDNHVNEIASTAKPKPTTGRGWERSTMPPTTRASRPVATAVGAITSAEI